MMRLATRLVPAAVLTALITSAALGTAAAGHTAQTVIHFTVRVSSARFHVTDVPPNGPSAGDSFQESNSPPRAAALRRQDAIGIATFQRATVLGTITLKNGQIVYAGTIKNQDNAVYAILGGTGTYNAARGTLTVRALPQGRAEITIRLTE